MVYYPRLIQKEILKASKIFSAVFLGLEIDFLVPMKRSSLALLEVKAFHTLNPAAANSLLKIHKNIQDRSFKSYIIYRPLKKEKYSVINKEIPVQGVSCEDFIKEMDK